jgi:hypothetical protein
MPTTPLSDDEIDAIRTLIPIADEVKSQAEYRMAQRLVFKAWRQTIIAISGFIAAAYLLRDQIAKILGVP